MTTVRKFLYATAQSLQWIADTLGASVQSRLQQARDHRTLSRFNERQVRELGISRNADNDGYYHRN